MIKLIVTDLDGTILDGEGKLSEEFELVFDELEKRDIMFMAASGRQYPNLKELFRAPGEKMDFIAENGTFAIHKGKELFTKPIDMDSVCEIIDYTRPIERKEIVLNTKYCAYIENPEFVPIMQIYNTSIKVVDDLKEVKEDVLKVSIYDYGIIGEHCSDYFEKFSDRMQVCTSGDHWMDLARKGTNKGDALEEVKRLYNLKDDEVMIFGDQMNDLEMMKCGYYSYAMENAIDEVKEAARFTAGKNTENGVLEKIKEVIGIEV